MNLKDKVALVTGGASGIGEAISTKLAKEGAHVIVNYNHSEAKARALCEKLTQEGLICSSYQGDVSKFEETQTLAKKIISNHGKIDILVNNAGITKDQLLFRMTEDDFDRVIETNLKGSWNMIKAVSMPMSKAKFGKIINITSISGVMGNAGQTNYSASKAGLIGLTKSVAREFAKRNITCNAVAPGFIETNMTAELPESLKEKYIQQIPVGRYGHAEDVASLVNFLVSNEANYITGQVVHVDGGLVMN